MEDQPTLPFDFYQEEKDAFLAKLPHYDQPTNDNERLLNFQYEYFRNQDQNALGKFYQLLEEIGYKFVNTETHRNKHIRGMPAFERQRKAHDAATYMVEQLLARRNEFFYFGQPDKKTGEPQKPTGYLWLRVFHEIYYRKKAEEIQDFVDLALFFKEGTDEEACVELELYEEKICGRCAYCSKENGIYKCLLNMEEVNPDSSAEKCELWCEP